MDIPRGMSTPREERKILTRHVNTNREDECPLVGDPAALILPSGKRPGMDRGSLRSH